MNVRAMALLLAALPAAGGTRVAELPVAFYTSFEQPASPAVVEAMRTELRSILAPSGMRFEWRTLDHVSGSEVSSELAVLTFKGRCDVEGLSFRSAAVGALGWTHVTDGVILPFADIDCDHLRLFLQRELIYLSAAEREVAFGRALARVVAHELYHIFVRTADHASDGICKSAFSMQELLAPDFQIKSRNMAELKRQLPRAEIPEKETQAQPAGGTF
jgi:hypothetical protein